MDRISQEFTLESKNFLLVKSRGKGCGSNTYI